MSETHGKFIVSSALLTSRLAIVKKVVSTKPIVPILENFLFELDSSMLSVTTSDLQTTMATLIPVDTKSTACSACVPVKLLTELLDKLPEQPLTFVLLPDEQKLTIMAESGYYQMPVFATTDWPESTEATEPISAEMDAQALHTALTKTAFATSEDDLKPAMTAVCLESDVHGLSFTGTDGHRISRVVRVDQGMPAFKALMPRKSAAMLIELLKTDIVQGNVTLEIMPSAIRVDLGPYTLLCQQIDEEHKYPGTAGLLSKFNPYILEIERTAIVNATKRLLIFAERETAIIRLKLREAHHEGLTMIAFSETMNRYAREDFKLSKYSGEDLDIGFNGKLLLEMIEHVDGPSIELSFMSPKSECIFRTYTSTEGQEHVSILMPHALLDNPDMDNQYSTDQQTGKKLSKVFKKMKEDGISVSVKGPGQDNYVQVS